MRNRLQAAVFIFVITCATTTSASARMGWDERALRTEAISFGPRTPAPFGAIVFCQSYAAQCIRRTARGLAVTAGRAVATPYVLQAIQAANALVNRRMRPENDPGETTNDLWQVGQTSGDCEDYALAKRAILVRAGFPTSAVLMATANILDGGRHAVLIVRTTAGDFVLDNLAVAVRPWRAVDYHWTKIQSPDDPTIWLKL